MLLQTLENKVYCLLYRVCSIFFGLCLVSHPSALCFKTTFARMYWKKNSLLLTGMGSKILSAALPCLCSWCPVHPFKRARAITAEQDGVLSHDLSKSAFDNAVIPLVKVSEHWNGISTWTNLRCTLCTAIYLKKSISASCGSNPVSVLTAYGVSAFQQVLVLRRLLEMLNCSREGSWVGTDE